ncbi:MAG: rod shape-determining protein RodA [Bdellovibrionales bacterium]|nr:rod shape-determining protein RodA [Bdellovibrionales bacterium]
MSRVRQFVTSIDWVLLSLAMSISSIGLLVLYSASYDPDVGRSALVTKQLSFFVLGVFIALFTASIPSRFWYRIAYFFYGSSLALLCLVLVYGTISNGSRRWINLGPINLQPSELMKVGVILALGRYLSKAPPKNGVYRFRELLMPGTILLVPMLVILKQPDLGTALTVGAVGAGMILFVGVNKLVLGAASLLGVLGAGGAWMFVLHSYQKRRILTLFYPEGDPQGSGWQIIQSKIAVGSGEIFGKGYLQGSQTQLEFIPERTTDFIFCVLAEEWGFIGSLILLGLYFAVFARILFGVSRSKDYFGALIGVGVTGFIFFHAFVNLGMVVGFLPVVGLPLPMFSYGGSSMLTMFFSLGLVLSLTSSRSVFSSR